MDRFSCAFGTFNYLCDFDDKTFYSLGISPYWVFYMLFCLNQLSGVCQWKYQSIRYHEQHLEVLSRDASTVQKCLIRVCYLPGDGNLWCSRFFPFHWRILLRYLHLRKSGQRFGIFSSSPCVCGMSYTSFLHFCYLKGLFFWITELHEFQIFFRLWLWAKISLFLSEVSFSTHNLGLNADVLIASNCLHLCHKVQ